MANKKITLEDNICTSYHSRALTHKPCSPGAYYHALDCGHTVAGGSGCASNCAEPGSYGDSSSSSTSDGEAQDIGTFHCALCILKDFDPFLDDQTCTNDLRYLLGNMGHARMSDAEELLDADAEGKRYTQLAKPWDWLWDFINEDPEAYVEQRAEVPVGEPSGGPLAQVRMLLREQARENEKEARRMNWERGLLRGGGEVP